MLMLLFFLDDRAKIWQLAVTSAILQFAGIESIRMGDFFGNQGLFISGIVIECLAAGMLVIATGCYAATKGYSRWFCFAGLLSIVGMLVLRCFPDRSEE